MNTTTVNGSDEYAEGVNKKVIPYLIILLIMGTIGNCFGILVFLNSSMRKYSCSLYFLLMLIFDELALLFWVTNRLHTELTTIRLPNYSLIFCKLYVIIY